MSGLFDSGHWLPWAVLTAALVGSPHCAGMCGGLVMAVCRSKSDHVRYQIGRGLAYAALGSLAGGVGEVFLSLLGPSISWVAAGLMALGFILMGIQVWRTGSFHLPVPDRWFRRLPAIPLVIGFGSAVLPCGFLHAFVLASATTGSALAGAAFMSVFWMGTLPAVVLAPGLLRAVGRRVQWLQGPRATRVLAVGFLLLGLGTVSAKMKPQFEAWWHPELPPAAHSCHESQ